MGRSSAPTLHNLAIHKLALLLCKTSLSTSKMVASGGGHGYVRLLMDLVNAIDNLVTGNATLEEFWKVRPARRAIFFVYSENFAYLSFSLNSPTNLFLSTHQRSSQISVPRSLSLQH